MSSISKVNGIGVKCVYVLETECKRRQARNDACTGSGRSFKSLALHISESMQVWRPSQQRADCSMFTHISSEGGWNQCLR